MKQKARIDKESPWCKVVHIRQKRPAVRAVRMVGTNRNPGGGKQVYLHIEGVKRELLHISGRENLRAIARMILDGIR